MSFRGVAKAYPLQILVWHEIVNDNFSGLSVAITYCPLCYSSAAYVREINGTPVEFGTSGKLYNNNCTWYENVSQVAPQPAQVAFVVPSQLEDHREA